MNSFINLPLDGHGLKIEFSQLKIERAISFYFAIKGSKSSTIVECFKMQKNVGNHFFYGDEIIVFDTIVNVGQRPINDIRFKERIAVHFDVCDLTLPWVYALRSDFPQVSHLNSVSFRYPKCLCIYEKLYAELKLEWRSIKFLQDIRMWLKLTSENNLHHGNQPLEPFFVTRAGSIIFPSDIKQTDQLFAYTISAKEYQTNLILLKEKFIDHSSESFTFIHLKLKPRLHGVIGFTPISLWDLHKVLEETGDNLFEILKSKLNIELKVLEGENKLLLERKLILFLEMPKSTSTKEKELDYFVFITKDTIKNIGLNLNYFVEAEGIIGQTFPPSEPQEVNAKELLIFILSPQFILTKAKASELSNSKNNIKTKEITITQIGVGALGSQIFINHVKKGIGNWLLVDEDILLPHNLVKHTLNFNYLLKSKSESLKNEAEMLLYHTMNVDSLWDDYFYPLNKTALDKRLMDTQVILDISTSIAIARDLAFREDTQAKRISIFINPAGTDLIILAEDKKRVSRLDILEFQYYRNLVNNEKLKNHLAPPKGEVRYAGGCRDVTSKISQENISILGSVASKILEGLLTSKKAFMGLWQIHEESMAVHNILMPIPKHDIIAKDAWKIIIDDFVLSKIDKKRTQKLPSETGGILIGGYDFSRNIIYIVDTILSPKDSEEYPNAYIRGTYGLKEKLEAIDQKTVGHLKYIGEWHSHPDNYSLKMSGDDKKLFKSVEDEMTPLGYPTLILIAGRSKKYEIYLN